MICDRDTTRDTPCATQTKTHSILAALRQRHHTVKLLILTVTPSTDYFGCRFEISVACAKATASPGFLVELLATFDHLDEAANVLQISECTQETRLLQCVKAAAPPGGVHSTEIIGAEMESTHAGCFLFVAHLLGNQP